MKKKGKKIGSLALIAIAVIGIVAGIEFILAPGIISSFFLTFGQAAPMCDDAPYNPSCVCNSEEERLVYSRSLSIDRYFCESLEKVVDIDQEGWETEAEIYAKARLTELFPSCNMINCDQGQTELRIGAGYMTGEGIENVERGFFMECFDTEQAITFSQISINSATGESMYEFCSDYTRKDEGKSTVTIIPRGYYFGIWGCVGIGCAVGDDPYRRGVTSDGSRFYETYYYIGVNCENIGSDTFDVTFVIPEIETITSASASGIAIDGYTTQINGNKVTYTIPYSCGSGYGYNLIASAYVSEPQPYVCQTDTGMRFIIGNTIVCNTDHKKYECQPDGTWAFVTDGATTANSRCPA